MAIIRWNQRNQSPSRERLLSPRKDAARTRRSLQYVVGESENSAQTSYQEVSGAPVESRSPLGYHVGPITILFLNLSRMVGTGIYSTPAIILKSTGSVGAALIYWFVGFLFAVASMSIYLEFASYFPNRSGSETVYLEQSYPRPKYFFPVTFAMQSVLLSFSASNAIVLAQYVFRIGDHSPTPWQQKGVAVAAYTLAFLIVAFSTRYSYLVSNTIGLVKLFTLIFIAVTGLVVLSGTVSHIPHPTANFHDAFSTIPGTVVSTYGYTNALYKIAFSYAGYENAFSVNPVTSLRNSGGLALITVAVLYMLANIAYLAAVPREELVQAKEVVASLFFENVFGSNNAVRILLNFLIVISAFGNLVSVLLAGSRGLRECGRQGVLPFPSFWVNTRPFGTPIGPYFWKWSMTMIMILAPPAGDAFNFVVDLATYPSSLFALLTAVGIFFIRRRRKALDIPKPAKGYSFEAWHLAIVVSVCVNVFKLVMPWYPPPGGAYGGDVSFWYATYAAAGIGILVACVLYYVLWIHVIPKWRGYRMRHETVILSGGEVTHRLVKVPVSKLEAWDELHDAQGRKMTSEERDV